MSDEKIKSENYMNFGGINSKISPYQNTILEFLNIINFDFQMPGSLTQRWGSTQYIGQTFPGQINSIFEYQRLNGTSLVVISHSGGIWYGATTGQYQGMSFSGQNATINSTIGSIITVVVFGGSISQVGVPIYYQGALSSYLQGGLYFNQDPQIQSDNISDSVVFQNYMFSADGNKFFKFDGSTTTFVSLPPPLITGSTFVVNNAAAAATVGVGNATLYSYGFFASYVNSRGFESQIWPIAYVDATQGNAASMGGSFIYGAVQLSTPLQYGISSINLYSYASATVFRDPAGGPFGGVTLWQPPYVFLANYAASGSTLTNIPLGTSTGNFSNLISNIGNLANPKINSRFPLGITLVQGGTNSFYAGVITQINLANYFPRYLEVYNNRLFCSGFSSAPSTVWFSDVGEPEGFQLGNNFEVRTNDADYITCTESYSTRFYIFKKNSFHALYGDNPNNFYLQEVSTSYGCINNNCAVIYADILTFLDRKGVMYYNGANIMCLSDKVQSYFDRMNYNVAISTACMIHDKLRNQLLVAIPIDGSLVNNIIMVYDYLAKAWTTYNGISPSIFATVQGYNNTKNAFYGSISGTINWFGPSFTTDNGQGITTYFKTRYLHDMGDSIQKQFRRLYINADFNGTTYTMPVNFYQDYGTSVILGRTFVLSQFQKRIDFGISAKSLAFELYNLNASSPLRIHGFTVESRMQRRV